MNGNGTHKSEKEKYESSTQIASSKSKLAASLEVVGGGDYVPSEHRDQTYAIGTTGALFHMMKGSMGSGILQMPVAFKNGGLWVSLVGTLFVGLVCTHCVHLLVYASQELSRRVRRPMLGYAATAEAAFATGPKALRKYSVAVREFVDGALMITYYFGTTVYIVFIASTLKQVLEAHADVDLNPRLYTLAAAVVIVPVGSIRRLKYLVPFSFVAILFLLFGCGFVLRDVFADLPPLDSRPAFTSLRSLPLFYATVLYALEGIGTVLPIENAMREPRHFLGWPGVLNISMGLLVVMYAAMGFLGYLRYGEHTQGSVSLNLGTSMMGETVKVLVSLNVLCSYGLCFCVPADIVWSKVEDKVPEAHKTLGYYAIRISLVLGAVALATALPDLEPFVGLVGAICYSTLGLLFPTLIDLAAFSRQPGYGRLRVAKNLFLVFMWLVALTAGTRASVEKILESLA